MQVDKSQRRGFCCSYTTSNFATVRLKLHRGDTNTALQQAAHDRAQGAIIYLMDGNKMLWKMKVWKYSSAIYTN